MAESTTSKGTPVDSQSEVSRKPGRYSLYGHHDSAGSLSRFNLMKPWNYLTLGRLSLLLRRRRVTTEIADAPTTIFHVTQYKAGSQWIYNILLQCVPDRLVHPRVECAQFIWDEIVPGKIYPTIYLPRGLFYKKSLPSKSRHFVMLRDLRDILVSAFFSITGSHPELGNVRSVRRKLSRMSREDGLLWTLYRWLPWNAVIFESWVKSGEPWIKYEDLLANDVDLLEEVLIDRCELDVNREALRQAIINCRFVNLSGGRSPGAEDVDMHYRKGIAGDWQNHFTAKIKKVFKREYGRLLIDAGYETDMNW
jgi:hypothetical protein